MATARPVLDDVSISTARIRSVGIVTGASGSRVRRCTTIPWFVACINVPRISTQLLATLDGVVLNRVARNPGATPDAWLSPQFVFLGLNASLTCWLIDL
jgi:hypothetical protein